MIPITISLIPILSLVTTTKDYFEVVHKLMEFHPSYSATDYAEFGTFITYAVLTLKNFLVDIFTFNWLQNIWSLPIIIPDIASAMISEVSVLDGRFHNAVSFLETPLSLGKTNYSFYGLEKFFIGFINSFFLCLPTSAAHVIFFRRLVFQGIEGGYIAGIGIIAGNILWFTSIIFGWRFLVIPWLSLDILRYLLGFGILVKFMWDTSRDKRVLYNLSKSKIFLINFLLAFTEQTNIYPFVTNMSVGAESSLLETFPVDNLGQFIFVHAAYVLGLLAGSLSLLNLTCWLWENPIAQIYTRLRQNFYMPNFDKNLNLFFLYLTMLCTISSFTYFGLDYTLTNPLGLVSEDRILFEKKKGTNQPQIPELFFLNSKATDSNKRNKKNRRSGAERWRRKMIQYKGIDTSLYNKGVYDLFTIEDLNYGFDKTWLRRGKLRTQAFFEIRIFRDNLKALKAKKNQNRLATKDGARVEGFRMLSQLFYHPAFHSYSQPKQRGAVKPLPLSGSLFPLEKEELKGQVSQNLYQLLPYERAINKSFTTKEEGKPALLSELILRPTQKSLIFKIRRPMDKKLDNGISALRKFVRKINTRIKSSEILLDQTNLENINKPIYSKRWKQLLYPTYAKHVKKRMVSSNKDSTFLIPSQKMKIVVNDLGESWQNSFLSESSLLELQSARSSQNPLSLSKILKMQKERLSKKDRQILRYKTKLALFLSTKPTRLSSDSYDSEARKKAEKYQEVNNATTMLHPIKFYLQKEKAFSRKLKFYGASVFRNLSIENNAPYFRIMMKRLFYFYKPTKRYKKSFKAAGLTKGIRIKRLKSRASHKRVDPLDLSDTVKTSAGSGLLNTPISINVTKREKNQSIVDLIKKPTNSFRIGAKSITRLRTLITKQTLFHWYYAPFNRLLGKIDIDLFIRRQPTSHFLTKKDEQGLHLKRYLLADHYETLRWYTFMQHYRSMKTKIGGTKSFASKFAYNQQFQGTLKKVRHLFAITPSLFPYTGSSSSKEVGSPNFLATNQNKNTAFDTHTKDVLKFDQPLYNEYSNSKTHSIINDSVTHEELLSPYNSSKFESEQSLINSAANSTLARSFNDPQVSSSDSDFDKNRINNELKKDNARWQLAKKQDDFIALSTSIVREYLETAKPIRQATIKKLILDKNYKELTQFLLSGQKVRGLRATINQRLLLNQESQLGESKDKAKTQLPFNQLNNQTQLRQLLEKTAYDLNIENDVWFSLLQNYKKGLYDEEDFLQHDELAKGDNLDRGLATEADIAGPISRNVDQDLYVVARREEYLAQRLKNLEKWLTPNPSNPYLSSYGVGGAEVKKDKGNNGLLTTGLRKAIKESVPFGRAENEGVKNSLLVQSTERSKKEAIFQSVIKKQYSPKSFFSTGFIKIKGVSNLMQNKIQAMIKGIIDKPASFLKLKARTRKKMDDWIINQGVYGAQEDETQVIQKENANPSSSSSSKEAIVREDEYSSHSNSLLRSRLISKTKESSYDERKGYRLSFPSFSSKNQKKDSFIISKKTPYSERQKKIFNTDLTKGQASNSDYELSIQYFTTLFNRGNKFSILPKFQTMVDGSEELEAAQVYEAGNEHPINRTNSELEIKAALKKQAMALNTGINSMKTDNINLDFWQDPDLYPSGQATANKKYAAGEYEFIRERWDRGLTLEKKIKQIQLNLKLQQWWWLSFGPSNLIATAEAKLQLAKYSSFATQLISGLSRAEILNLDYINTLNSTLSYSEKQVKNLQIGDYDFKPLAIPQSLRIHDRLSKNSLGFTQGILVKKPLFFPASNQKIHSKLLPLFVQFAVVKSVSALRNEEKTLLRLKSNKTSNLINQLYINIFNLTPIGSRTKKKGAINIKMPLASYQETVLPLSYLPSDKKNKKNRFSILIQNRSPKSLSYDSVFFKEEKKRIISSTASKKISNVKTKFFVDTNPLPFYAGWDESLRKFVVTNRLLSRRDAGYSVGTQASANSLLWLRHIRSSAETLVEFTNAPSLGLNAATTVYFQVPFKTFNREQLFPKGMDGFAPLGWRRFEFTHTIFKTKALKEWLAFSSKKNKKKHPLRSEGFLSYDNKKESEELKPLLIKNITQKTPSESESDNWNLIYKKRRESSNGNKPLLKIGNYEKIQKANNSLYRIKAQFDGSSKFRDQQPRSKSLINPLVSGPLINEVLPLHYTNIFVKESRRPKNRYMSLHLKREAKAVPKAISEFASFLSQAPKKSKLSLTPKNLDAGVGALTREGLLDFTYRRRAKTRRKFHRKSKYPRGFNVIPRRHKFFFALRSISKTGLEKQAPTDKKEVLQSYQVEQELIRSRPTKRRSKTKRTDLNLKNQRRKARQKRVRRIGKRTARLVINHRKKERFQPLVGGFVWPGDYLRLTSTDSPKLVLKNENSNKIIRRMKKRASIPNDFAQSRTYLIREHNIRVVKKKLEKAQRSNKIKQRIKEYQLSL